MQVMITESYDELSRAGADLVAGVIADNPAAALVLATGETPIGVYGELAQRYRRGELDTSRLRIFQLDAYWGLAPDDPRSLYGWLARAVLGPLEIRPEQVVRLPGDAGDPLAVCRAYDAAVEAAGGFDLALLGLGPNGHLGFNEPPAAPDSPTRLVQLTEASIVSNARYWGGRDRVPREALTAGMGVLLGARRTLLVVAGAHKRAILERTVSGPVGPEVPASFLQQVAQVAVLADRAAALKRRASETKPAEMGC